MDLRQQLDAQLDERQVGAVLFTKVKAHSTAEDVHAGRATLEDKLGNDAADALAVAGAKAHVERKGGVDDFNTRIALTLGMHKMMVAIVVARQAAQGNAPKSSSSDSKADEEDSCCSAGSTEGSTEGSTQAAQWWPPEPD